MVLPLTNPTFIPSTRRAFTLTELLVVIAVMAVAMAMVVPAFTNVKGAGDVTKAVYDVAGVLQTARSYATANNTYVWVGFFEENESFSSTTPATSGTGRIVMSIVASNNGTMIYSQPLTSSTNFTAGVSQVTKLIKIDDMHLTAFTGSMTGSGNSTGNVATFSSRPGPMLLSGSAATWQIGSVALSGSAVSGPYFQYPVGYPTLPTAQYTFTTAIQFNPRGEARLIVPNGSSPVQPLQTIVEIGLEPTHGTSLVANNQNVAAVQITGIAGNVQIYRQ